MKWQSYLYGKTDQFRMAIPETDEKLLREWETIPMANANDKQAAQIQLERGDLIYDEEEYNSCHLQFAVIWGI